MLICIFSISFSQAYSYCTSSTLSHMLRSPRYSTEFLRSTFYYRTYTDLVIPTTVTPPPPADTQTIAFSRGRIDYFNTIIVEGDYGNVELCGYYQINNVTMIDCDKYVHPVKVIACRYNL